MYKQVYDPVGHSLGLSSILAALALLVLFVLLGGLRWKAHWASLVALAVALVVAIAVYGMPVGQALDAGLEGAAFGFYPIMWIVINAIWVYNLTRETGHFEVLGRSMESISNDQRLQALVVAFCFGALIEALAGFGTPVAITSVMLIALGLRPLKAASVALVANTAPVAFGAIAVPITTLAQVSSLPVHQVGSMVGRQTPFLALFVPLALVFMLDGRRGVRQTWPAAVTCGVAFAIGQWLCSNYLSVQLTDIVAALVSAGAVVLLLRVWSPTEPLAADRRAPTGRGRPAVAGGSTDDPAFVERMGAREQRRDPPGEVLRAYLPYLIIVVLFSLTQLGPIKSLLDQVTVKFAWPGLDVVNAKGKPLAAATFKLDWLLSAGTVLLVSGLLTMAVLRVGLRTALRAYGATLVQLRYAILTVLTVLALAYVMNFSGQTITLGQWMAKAGGFFAFLSAILGWLGVAVSGSDTSSNSLFGLLQVTAAKEAGLSPTLLAAANSSGGVLGKMISPQNLAIGAAAVGMQGQEGDLFRRVLGWSLLFLLVMCVLVVLQSGPLSFMVP
ncbi:MAG TPA: L-lactate permease [Actinomycetes bacterium]|jgi:lactate permease|nr:L-lactate permease [Actinomycetes bacterium]